MKKIVFATGNKGKLKEIREILKDTGYDVVSMKEAGCDVPIAENGKTFEENSLIKARTVEKACGEITLADDSGLEIDALNGEPGIYSARWMGEETSYDIKNTEILKKMKDVPEEKRTARFVCVISAAYPDGREFTAKGIFEGRIAHEIRGVNGFGYDPIFYVPEKGCSSAELSPEEKNKISHRGQALRLMKEKLMKENGTKTDEENETAAE
jgi:XTP/dITP diphosphohydrolase